MKDTKVPVEVAIGFLKEEPKPVKKDQAIKKTAQKRVLKPDKGAELPKLDVAEKAYALATKALECGATLREAFELQLEQLRQNQLRDRVDRLEFEIRQLETEISHAVAEGFNKTVIELMHQRDAVMKKIFTLKPLLGDIPEGGLKQEQLTKN